MDSDFCRFTALSWALLSSQADAVGFGDIAVTSRLGEPLHAEVQIVADAAEQVDTACFRLGSARDQDLPSLTAARLQLHKGGNAYRISITGREPVVDPLFVIALRAGCGLDLQRDYIVMPLPPVAVPEASTLASVAEISAPPATRPRQGKDWQARPGESLENIAESIFPANKNLQRRMHAALLQANPRLAPAQPLPEGTAVRIPRLRQKTATDGPRPARNIVPAPALRQQPESATTRPQPEAKAAPTSGDRLQLSAPPPEFEPGSRPLTANPTATEERIVRMEAVLRQLNEEVARLNQALALTTEALATQQQLQSVQNAISLKAKEDARTSAPVIAATAPPRPASTDNWLTLLLAGAAGGILSLLASRYLLANRQDHPERAAVLPDSAEAGEAFGGSIETSGLLHRDIVETAVSHKPAAASPCTPGQGIDTEEEGDALMKIIEVMISFGKIQDATDTLAQHINEISPDQIRPWLMLLDLYRRSNRHEQFEALSGQIRQKFNIRVPTWEEAETGVPV